MLGNWPKFHELFRFHSGWTVRKLEHCRVCRWDECSLEASHSSSVLDQNEISETRSNIRGSSVQLGTSLAATDVAVRAWRVLIPIGTLLLILWSAHLCTKTSFACCPVSRTSLWQTGKYHSYFAHLYFTPGGLCVPSSWWLLACNFCFPFSKTAFLQWYAPLSLISAKNEVFALI